MICHLSDAFRMAGEKPLPDDSTLAQRTLIKWMALYAPLPWPTGKLVTRPEIDQVRGGGCSPGVFADDVARLVTLVDQFTTRDRRTGWPAHPFFGAMSSSAWLRWGYLHMASASAKALVWRGVGVKEIDTGAKPDKRDKNINKAVEKILKEYPPKVKS